MNEKELKQARLRLGLTMAAFARLLETPYRTYQSWEYGETPVPGAAKVAVSLLLEKIVN